MVDDLKTLILYHGTHRENKESILKTGFRISSGEDHWLGDGVYFYDTPKLAYQWMNKVRTTENKDILVLGTKIVVEKNEFHDLRDFPHNKNFGYTVERFKEALDYSGKCLHIEDKHEQYKFRKALSNMYSDIFRPKVLLGEFRINLDSQRGFSESVGFILNCEVQYCVKNVSAIKEIFELEEILELDWELKK